MAVIYDEFCGNCMINHEMTNMRNHYKALYLTNLPASFPAFGLHSMAHTVWVYIGQNNYMTYPWI